ncbi:MAG: endonuclease/exonuclease/phosphatase family protein [Polyangiaceae bacterium]|nr:endonuclease/exonuclease/phosphatase family protein [Polyangiaceae bacterium]
MPYLLRTTWVAIALLGASGCGTPDEETTPAAEPPSFRVLTANVGNPDTTDPNYALRLSYQAYEDFVGARIRALAPAVVFLQEVLPPEACAAFVEGDAARTCYDAAARPAAIERVLGTDYSIVCDARKHVECIGVRTDFATITAVEPGAFVLDGAETPPLPLAACSYQQGTCDDSNCDGESTVSAVTVTTDHGEMRIVHVHPNAAGENANGFYSGEPCRYGQLQQVFEGPDALVGATVPTLVAGDFNMDPDSFATQREMDLWDAATTPAGRFDELGPPRNTLGHYLPTRTPFAVDHVIADGLTGSCIVHGPAASAGSGDPNQAPPLDDGFDFASLGAALPFLGRIDHGSIDCKLWYAGG